MKRISYILIGIMVISIYGYTESRKEKEEYIKRIKEKAERILIQSLSLTNGKLEYEFVGEAIMGIGCTRDRKYLSLLKDYLKDERLKKYAISGLSRMRQGEAEKILEEEYRKERNFSIKMNIAFALVQSGRTEYIGEFIKSLRSRNEDHINEALFYLRLIDLNKDNLYEKYKVGEEIDNLLEKRGFKTNYVVFVNTLKVMAYSRDRKFKERVEVLFAIDNYEMHFDAIQISETYLSQTNDTGFYLRLKEKFSKIINLDSYKDNSNKLRMVVLLYHFAEFNSEKERYLSLIEKFKMKDDFMKSLSLILTGNRKYIVENLKNKSWWSYAVRSIGFNKVYEAKKDLIEILKKGIPKQWENTQSEKHQANIIMSIVGTLKSIIYSKSPNVYRDIKEIEFTLDYEGLPEGYNEYVQMKAASEIYNLIWAYEIGEIPEKRFWGEK